METSKGDHPGRLLGGRRWSVDEPAARRTRTCSSICQPPLPGCPPRYCSPSLAAALAVVAAITAAQLVPTTWLSPQGLAHPPSTGMVLRRSYFAAAGRGLAIAGLWGIAAAVVVVDFQDPAYLRWTLTPPPPSRSAP
ncbi:hypothetical protein [Actinoplanes sp. NPDC049265]|uniref:hypothetical protein n=1 Tax=Actinoplanes sp. NPDC049265 TaxID=3363902 RepID=UPI00371CE930